MANVKLMAGIEGISGKVGGLIFKTYKNGKIRMFRAEEHKRKKKLSQNEKDARIRFSAIAKEVSRMQAEGDTRDRKTLWAEVKGHTPPQPPLKGGNNPTQPLPTREGYEMLRGGEGKCSEGGGKKETL